MVGGIGVGPKRTYRVQNDYTVQHYLLLDKYNGGMTEHWENVALSNRDILTTAYIWYCHCPKGLKLLQSDHHLAQSSKESCR